ncbi:MAG: hypothetical protein A2481_02825 [Candidatus Yonathbacteria bacterium RIFOXYC2_FULL_47_9]|nr:MAG: hypothetical protein A2481_02825 [Candidatus Yonathbacteria bacterium RIFOXYC2_FULL_47_9]HAT68088.1 hypothetical protein [Candidatus Yonathbacteria bacterium]
MLAPLATPLALLVRLAIRKARSVSLWVRVGKHHASYKKGKIGLAELVRHRASMMETLYERRKTLSSGAVVVRARFRYLGERGFIGGNGKLVQPGDIISAEFIIGRNKGEFLITGEHKEILPKQALFYWGNPKNSHGSITPGSA